MSIITRLKRAATAFKTQTFTPSSRDYSKVLQWLKDDTNQIETTTEEGQVKAYLQCPPVSTIISKKAQAFVRGDFYVGEEEKRKDNDKLYQLLSNPNPFQNFQQFATLAYTMN